MICLRAVPEPDLRRAGLDMIDALPVPELLKDRVGGRGPEDILDRFFPEIMVDAVNLLFVSEPGEFLVQLLRGSEVMAEGLFHDHALPCSRGLILEEQLCFVKMFDHLAELAR